jgi:hypothetical protein
MGNQSANSQSIGSSGRSKEHVGTLAPRRETHPHVGRTLLSSAVDFYFDAGEPAYRLRFGLAVVNKAVTLKTTGAKVNERYGDLSTGTKRKHRFSPRKRAPLRFSGESLQFALHAMLEARERLPQDDQDSPDQRC